MAVFMSVVLDVDNQKTLMWQKTEANAHIVVTSQVVSYVDANGTPLDLPEVYEMTVVDGIEHAMPGVV